MSGQVLEGNFARIGAPAVALSELVGMEFFDVTILLDQVAGAINIRSK
jgi:hypothetical protein